MIVPIFLFHFFFFFVMWVAEFGICRTSPSSSLLKLDIPSYFLSLVFLFFFLLLYITADTKNTLSLLWATNKKKKKWSAKVICQIDWKTKRFCYKNLARVFEFVYVWQSALCLWLSVRVWEWVNERERERERETDACEWVSMYVSENVCITVLSVFVNVCAWEKICMYAG